MRDDLKALLGQSSLPESLLGDLQAVLEDEQEEENLSIKRGDRGTDKIPSSFFDEEEEEEDEEGGEQKKNEGPLELPHKKRKKETRAAMNDLMGPDVDEIAAVANKRQKPKKKAVKRKKKSLLTPAQDAQMQEATNAYIDGKFKQAVTILLNLIKEAPKVFALPPLSLSPHTLTLSVPPPLSLNFFFFFSLTLCLCPCLSLSLSHFSPSIFPSDQLGF